MTRFARWMALLIALGATSAACAQTGAVQRHCYLGGQQALLSGMQSTNYQQGIVPACTVTVYLTGTQTLATIYADGSNTPLSNPFTANVSSSLDPGGWIFWAATSQGLDIVLSGGGGDSSCTTAPNCYTTPVALTDVYPSAQFAVINPLDLQTNGAANSSQALLNFLNSATCDFTNPSGGEESVNCTPTGNQSVQMFVQAPASGQYVVLYPTAAPTTTSSGSGNAVASADSNAPFSGQIARTASCSTCGSNASISWTGTVLPSYITASNVTAIYGGFVSTWEGSPFFTGTKGATVNSTAVTGINNESFYSPGTYSVEIASGSGAQTFDYATVNWSVSDASSENWGYSPFSPGPIPSTATWVPVLFVYYTGTAPPNPTAIQVLPPLNLANGALSLPLPIDGGLDTGAANAYVVAMPPSTTQATGLSLCFLPAHSSTSTTPTLNVNGWGGLVIVKQGGAALASGDISATAVACVRLDVGENNQQWELQDPQTGGGTAVPTVGAPTAGQAACIKAAGPPVVIGYCSTVVSSSGVCTCN